MSEKITILVKRAGPFTLPAKFERDAETKKKIRPICGPHMLRPGANQMLKSRWDETCDHPTILAHIEAGTLQVGATAKEVSEHTHAPDPLSGIGDMSIAKAKPWIEACDSEETLMSWRNSETGGKDRAGILDAIDDRLEALSGD